MTALAQREVLEREELKRFIPKKEDYGDKGQLALDQQRSLQAWSNYLSKERDVGKLQRWWNALEDSGLKAKYPFDMEFHRLLGERLGYEIPEDVEAQKQLTYPNEGEKNATQIEQKSGGVSPERGGNGPGGTPPPASAGGGILNPEEGVQGAAPKEVEALTDPKPGTVRLYRGSGGVEGAGTGGSFFSRDVKRARTYGPNVEYVDVPEDVANAAKERAKKEGSGTSGDHVLPNEWVNKSKSVPGEIAETVHDLGDVETPVKSEDVPKKYPGVYNNAPKNQMPIEIKKADGKIVPGLLNGFYDLESFGKGKPASVAVMGPNGWSHGILKAGEEIITPGITPESHAEFKRKNSTAPQSPAKIEEVKIPPPKEFTDIWGGNEPPPKGVGSVFSEDKILKEGKTPDAIWNEWNRLAETRDRKSMVEFISKRNFRTPGGALRAIMLEVPMIRSRNAGTGEIGPEIKGPEPLTPDQKEIQDWTRAWRMIQSHAGYQGQTPEAMALELAEAKDMVGRMQQKFGVRDPYKRPGYEKTPRVPKPKTTQAPAEILKEGDRVTKMENGRPVTGVLVRDGARLFVRTQEGASVRQQEYVRGDWKLDDSAPKEAVKAPEYTPARLTDEIATASKLSERNSGKIRASLENAIPGVSERLQKVISDLRQRMAQQGLNPDEEIYGIKRNLNRFGETGPDSDKIIDLLKTSAEVGKAQFAVENKRSGAKPNEVLTGSQRLLNLLDFAEKYMRDTDPMKAAEDQGNRLIESRKVVPDAMATRVPGLKEKLQNAGYGQLGDRWIPPSEPKEEPLGPGEHRLEVNIHPFPPAPKIVREIIDDFLKPAAERTVAAAKAAKDIFVYAFSPTSAAKPADVDTLYKSKGYKELFLTRAAGALEGSRDLINGMTHDQQVSFVDRIKRGVSQPTKELQDVASLLRQWDDHLYNEANKYSPDTPYLDNHYRVLWKEIPGSAGLKGTALEQFMSKRPWRGSSGWKLRHTLEDMSEGIAKGGVPVSYNPIDMFLLHAQDVMKFVAANRAWEDLKKSGQAEFVKIGEQAPEGYTRLSDNIAKPYFRQNKVLSKTGEWWVQKDAARLIENYLSNDWVRQGKFAPIGKSLLDLKNATTAVELGFSPFHAVFVTNEALGSSIALSIAKMSEGQFSEALKSLGNTPKIYSEGAAIEKFAKNPNEFKSNYPSQYAWMKQQYPDFENFVNDLFSGGGQVSMDDDYKVKGLRSFKEAVKNDKYVGAVVNALPALNDKILSPIFNDYIPRLKLGTWMREYAFELDRRQPDLASGKVTREQLAREAWAFTEDRFGELNWDNLYWNRTFKSVMQLAFRSVTWKLGNARAFGKATRDLGYFARDVAQGNRPTVTQPMAWAVAMALVTAVQSTIVSKLFTGKYPWQLAGSAAELARNLTFPRIDKDDQSQRVSIPTYWKDVVHAVPTADDVSHGRILKKPIDYIRSSMSGEIGRITDVWSNRDFYGNKVYNEDDPFYKRIKDQFQHLFPVPFNVSSFNAARESGATPARSALGFLGFTKAPYYISHTPAEIKAAEILREQLPVGGRTQEQAQKSLKEHKAMLAVKRGEMTIDEAYDRGLLDPARWRENDRLASETHLQSQIKRLTPENALKVWQEATPEERREIRDDIEQKIWNSKSLSWEDKDKLMSQLK